MLGLFDLIAAMACSNPIHSAAITNRVLQTIPKGSAHWSLGDK